MSTWRFVVSFEWPTQLPAHDDRAGARSLQDLVFDLLDPLNRDNVTWYEARLELDRDPDGSY